MVFIAKIEPVAVGGIAGKNEKLVVKVDIVMPYVLLFFLIGFLLTSCSSSPKPPSQPHNICKIFQQYPDWYEDAKDMREEWGTPISLAMAFIKQESAFVHNAKAPKKYFLGFIPKGRKSSSLGYSQALDGTWGDFEKATNNSWDRTDFADSLQFVGWYTHSTKRKFNLPFSKVYDHYYAYYAGHGGYQRTAKSREGQAQAISQISHKVAQQAKTYREQLLACQAKLNKKRHWWFW